jgi:Uma2 family endonuclease
MPAGTLISLDEYLRTSYRPDCEYVDGVLVDRNVGKREHSLLQTKVARVLDTLGDEKRFWTFTEQRVQVTPKRVRIPDVCVVLGQMPAEDVLTAAPFLCIEILSPDDRMIEMQERIDDYLALGVPWVWVINPKTRTADIHTRQQVVRAPEGVLTTENPNIRISLPEIYNMLAEK